MTESWYEPPAGEKLGIDAEVDAKLDSDIDAEIAAEAAADLPALVTTAVNAAEATETAAAAAAKVVHDIGNSGSAAAVALTNGHYQKVTLTASGPTLTVTGFTAGSYDDLILYLVQDGTGSRTLPTFSPAAHYGAAGAPTLSTAPASVDVLKLSSIDGGTTLDVVLVEKGA